MRDKGNFNRRESSERRPDRGSSNRGGSDRARPSGGRFSDRSDRGGFNRRPPSDRDGGGFDKRDRFMKRSRESVMDALKSRDMLLGGVTKTMEDLDQTINLLGERLEFWYGIYFPELRMEDRIKYCEVVLAVNKEDILEDDLSALVGPKKAGELVVAAKSSLGAKISSQDMMECHSLARSILTLDKLRKQYDGYQKKLAQEICPNMSAVGGADVAAKLVSHVGSLARLAVLPSSTIQVLGAEKALFKHLRNKRIDPPKHGIIFQHVRISSSPRDVRGKIARALANKLALAAKADFFTKRDLSASLKKDFEDRYEQIMKERLTSKKSTSESEVEQRDRQE
ncbi:hypothetical protein HZC07_01175 [Candidatus Micrarchaeota archaeon]|nr:hypothetical protein [Candidatus Micrarchaeota archaeon]